MIDGTLTKLADGSHVVAFNRAIARPIEPVWRAITDPAVLKNWLGDVEVEPRVGGKYIIRFRDISVVMTGAITVFEPPRVLEYTWLENYGMPQSLARWELSSEGAGTRLTLRHSFTSDAALKDVLSFMGGWHSFLDVIARAADGEFVPYQDEKPLDAQYRTKFLG